MNLTDKTDVAYQAEVTGTSETILLTPVESSVYGVPTAGAFCCLARGIWGCSYIAPCSGLCAVEILSLKTESCPSLGARRRAFVE